MSVERLMYHIFDRFEESSKYHMLLKFFSWEQALVFLPEVKCFKAFDFFYVEILLTISTT